MLSHRSSQTVLFAVILLLAGCGSPERPDIPITDVALHLEIGRLDREVFHTVPDSMQALNRKAYASYGGFYRTYIEDILQGAPLEDPRMTAVLGRFVNDPDWASTQTAVDTVLGDLEPERLEFENGFKRLKVLFPDSITPRIVAFNSGYNYGIYPTDSVLGIGLEWFIGRDHPVIGYLAPEAFPQYVKDRMRPEMLVPSAMKGWLLVHYTHDIQGADLLTNLVETGKVMTLLDELLPDTDPALKFAFSKEQLAWCQKNEYEIWKDIVTKDQLYSRRTEDIGRWMNDGPFTSGLPRESPGHIGEWIGYRMVSAFRDANPGISWEHLMAMDDSRIILKSYKPR